MLRSVASIIGLHLLFTIFLSINNSVVAFFNFSLGHGLSVLDDWIYRNAWQLIVIAKIFTSIVLWNILRVQDLKFNFDIFLQRIYLNVFQYKNFVSSLCLLLVMIILGRPEFRAESYIELGKIFYSMLGNSIFFTVDLLLLLYFFKRKEGRTMLSRFTIIAVNIGCYVVLAQSSLRFSTNFTPLTIVMISLIFLPAILKREGIYLTTVLMVTVWVPLSSLFEFDMIWGNSVGVYSSIQSFDLSQLIVLFLITYFYRFLPSFRNKSLKGAI